MLPKKMEYKFFLTVSRLLSVGQFFGEKICGIVVFHLLRNLEEPEDNTPGLELWIRGLGFPQCGLHLSYLLMCLKLA